MPSWDGRLTSRRERRECAASVRARTTDSCSPRTSDIAISADQWAENPSMHPTPTNPLSFPRATALRSRACLIPGHHEAHRNASRCSSTSVTVDSPLCRDGLHRTHFQKRPRSGTPSRTRRRTDRIAALTLRHRAAAADRGSDQGKPDRARMVRSIKRDTLTPRR